MEVVVERGAGLDVHRDFVEACLVYGPRRSQAERRRFSTFPDGLSELREWVVALGCTEVVMESTSVYWMPVYEVLEGVVGVVVCNAQHVKNVPGRKTDVTDAHWLALLLRHGLVSNSYVPPRELRELRELTRYATKITQSRTAFLNRAHKTLQIGGIKLSSVASSAFGVSGRLMLEAVIEGEKSPAEIAELAKAALRRKKPQLEQVFSLRVSAHRRAVLEMQLRDIDRLEASLAAAERVIAERTEAHASYLQQVLTLPGVDRKAAAILLAEVGSDMSPWNHNFKRLAAWAGVAPGNKQSAGKRARVRTRDGNPYLKTILVEIAQVAVRDSSTRFGAIYRRTKARLGTKRALVKIARHWLESYFWMMVRNEPYREAPQAALDQRQKQNTARNLIKRLTELGYQVTAPTTC